MSISEIAECITATGAIVGIVIAFALRRHDLDRRRRNILIKFMRTHYNLDLDNDKLFQMWHQIEICWHKSEVVRTITTLQESISVFRALPNWNTILVTNRSYALKKINEARVQLCKQMHGGMLFLKPDIKEIVPFGRTYRNPL